MVHGLLPQDSPRPALKPVGGRGAEAHASVTVLHAEVFVVVVGGGRRGMGTRGGGAGGWGSKRRGCYVVSTGHASFLVKGFGTTSTILQPRYVSLERNKDDDKGGVGTP